MSTQLTTNQGNDAIQIAQHIDQIKGLGQTLVQSGLLPQGIRTPEAAVAIILKGRELGIPPMQALSHIHVINGKPTLSAELMLAIVMKAGHEVWISETTDERCTIHGKRAGSSREQSLTFTMDDARQAGVTANQTWKKYPAAMLRARAISAFARMFAPDVLMGASYTPEELGAEVNEDGEVISAPLQQEDQVLDAQFTSSVERDGKPAERPRVTPEQVKRLGEAMRQVGLGPKHKEDARAFVSYLIDRDVQTVKDLTVDEAERIFTRFADEGTGTGLNTNLLQDAVQEWRESQLFPPAPDKAPFAKKAA